MLSIFIPSYKFIYGIKTTLNVLNKSKYKNFQVFIIDDSPNFEIYDFFKNSIFNFSFTIKKGDQKGAVHNWNKLLKLNKNKYYMILHQDEVPCNDFIERLYEYLNLYKPEILSINTLVSKSKNKDNIHSSAFLRKIYLRINPDLIYFINFIGPISSLIFDKKIKFKFDTNLKWLVDVHLYNNLSHYDWKFTNKIFVRSLINKYSITSKTNIKFQKSMDIEYITKKNQNKIYSVINIFPIIAWYLIKLFKILK